MNCKVCERYMSGTVEPRSYGCQSNVMFSGTYTKFEHTSGKEHHLF